MIAEKEYLIGIETTILVMRSHQNDPLWHNLQIMIFGMGIPLIFLSLGPFFNIDNNARLPILSGFVVSLVGGGILYTIAQIITKK